MKNHMAAAMKSVSRYQRRNARKNRRIVEIEADERRDQRIDVILSSVLMVAGVLVAYFGVLALIAEKTQ